MKATPRGTGACYSVTTAGRAEDFAAVVRGTSVSMRMFFERRFFCDLRTNLRAAFWISSEARRT